MIEPTLSDAFLARLSDAQQAEARALPALEEQLEAMWIRARAAWPEVAVPPPAFGGHLAGAIGATSGAVALALGELHVDALYLACACAQGDARALRAFEDRYFGDIEPALVRITR